MRHLERLPTWLAVALVMGVIAAGWWVQHKITGLLLG